MKKPEFRYTVTVTEEVPHILDVTASSRKKAVRKARDTYLDNDNMGDAHITSITVESEEDPPFNKDDWRAFANQNGGVMAGLSPTSILAIRQYASHHAGGLFVCIRPLSPDGVYVKLHNSWGDDDKVIVHVYDADADDPNDDTQVLLPTGRGDDAARIFLDDVVLESLWASR